MGDESPIATATLYFIKPDGSEEIIGQGISPITINLKRPEPVCGDICQECSFTVKRTSKEIAKTIKTSAKIRKLARLFCKTKRIKIKKKTAKRISKLMGWNI